MKKILFKATCVIMLFCFTNSIVARKQRVRLKDITASINHIYSDESYLYRSPAYPDLNDRVKRILSARLTEYDEWEKNSEKELRKRFNIERSYLKSQVASLKHYTAWVKPSLIAAKKLGFGLTGII